MYRKNVASQNLPFALVNATTGAALTGATVTARRSIDGAAQANATGSVSELANGQYNLALSQADTNGNHIGILLTATGAIPVHFSIVTTAADPTDSVRLGLTALPNAAAGANGGLPLGNASGAVTLASATHTGAVIPTVTAVTNDVGITQAGADKVWGSATRTLTAFSTALAVSVWDVLASAVAAASSIGLQLKTNIDATVSSRLASAGYTAPLSAGATENAVWDAVRASHVTAGSFGQGAASVQGNVTGSVASVTGAVGSVTGNVGGNVVGSVASVTADVGITQGAADKVWLSAARTLTNFGTLVADVATAVWAAGTRTLTAISDSSGVTTLLSRLTSGRATNLDNLDAAVTTRASQTSVDDLPTNAELATALGTADDATLAAIAALNDLDATDVQTAAAAALTAYDGPTNAELATALAAADDAVLTAIDDLPTNAELTAALAAADDAMLASIAALNNLSAAQVTAAVPTAANIASTLIATALAELAQAQPSATPTVGQALMLPFMMLRNGGTFDKDTGISTYRNGAGTVVFKRTDVDDGAVLTEGALQAGP